MCEQTCVLARIWHASDVRPAVAAVAAVPHLLKVGTCRVGAQLLLRGGRAELLARLAQALSDEAQLRPALTEFGGQLLQLLCQAACSVQQQRRGRAWRRCAGLRRSSACCCCATSFILLCEVGLARLQADARRGQAGNGISGCNRSAETHIAAATPLLIADAELLRPGRFERV